MIQIKDFKPSTDSRAGLKDPISFRFSELSSTKLAPDTLPNEQERIPPEARYQFESLSDEEAVKIQNRKDNNILYYNPDVNVSSIKNRVEVQLPQATSDQITSELQRVSAVRSQVKNTLSYLARFYYPSDPIVDPQKKQGINYYSTPDTIIDPKDPENTINNINYVLTTKGTILDVYNQIATPDSLRLGDSAFSGFIQPTAAQLAFSRINYVANPGNVGLNNPIKTIKWLYANEYGRSFEIEIEQNLILLGVTRDDNVIITNSIPLLNNTFTIQNIRYSNNICTLTISLDTTNRYVKLGNKIKILDNKNNETGQFVVDNNNKSVQVDENYYLSISSLGTAQASLISPKMIVNNGSLFATDSPLTVVMPAGSYSSNKKTFRDVLFCFVKQKYNIDKTQEILNLQPSSFSQLAGNLFFNDQELIGINGNGDVIENNKKQGRDAGGTPLLLDLTLAVAGYPILVRDRVNDLCYSLNEIRDLIEAEIPQTKLYQPLTSIPESDYVGNLNKSSVCIYLHDDDKEIALVTNGQANPGAAIEFKLLNDPDKQYDVQTTITLYAPPVRIALGAPAFMGANAIKINGKFSPNSSGNTNSTGEYYFNKNSIVDNRQINLNRYVTVKIADKIKILKQKDGEDIELVENNTIQNVVEKDSLIILSQPLSSDLFAVDTKYFIEIPQTPLNANRNYKVLILASDRGGNLV